ADVILVNTCAIREHAEERVVGRLTQLLPHKKRSPGVRIGVIGCMAQHYRERLLDRLPFVDLILGPDEYRKLPHLLAEGGFDDPMVEVRLGREETYADLLPARTPGVRAWVTVMRGCDKFCSFCVVPFVRGRERSLPLDVLLEQVRDAAAEGFREVVLLGQTVNAYHDGDRDFADLLRGAAKVDGIERIRFTSPHPSDMSERAIEAMAAEPKICPQLHLPLQSASNPVLARMERGYTIEEYDALVGRLRRAIPGLELSTDVIVGFPGETEEDFGATRDYLAATGYDGAFLFAYSAREVTKAARWPETVPPDEKRRRLEELIALQQSISTARNRAWHGREVEVLVEGPAKRPPGWLAGKSAEFKTTVFASDRHAPGDLVRVSVRDSTPHTLIGEALENA
ncbi:MAG: tRNA-2-methylthio-N6-dimethylallyladenosine synthase, partial [Candidatus Binatota bacterium]|nr:tRNA-2-methylthio-N6-dimethylallyladenosine synthase [Candidatus Binatota bacterium]